MVVILIAVLLGGLAPSLQAQAPEDTAAALVRETYTAIRDEALSPPNLQEVLWQAVAAVQQALIIAGGTPPQPPSLTGREDDDLSAVTSFVRAAVRVVPPRSAESVTAAALRGMLQALRDPLGAIFTPSEFTRYADELRGEHQGIGAQVDWVNGQIVVSDVTEGGPAKRAGLQAGDVLLEVDGHAVAGRTPDQVMDWLRGQAGSSVTIRVRQRNGQTVGLTLTRARARENSTRSKMVEPRVGYLRLLEFSENSHGDVQRALTDLNAAGAAGLLLDLRDNTGGLVDESVKITSFFLSDGIVAMQEERGKLLSLDVVKMPLRFEGSIVVIVNRYTASASEIVAGALQDNGNPVLGTRTYGKATVQSVFPLEAGWGLRLTTARYYTRRGRAIEGVGLAPNIAVAMPEDLIQGPRDIQVEEALHAVRSRLEAPTRP